MPNYQEMYFSLFHKISQVTNLLIDIQREMEEIYIESSEGALYKLPSAPIQEALQKEEPQK